MAIKRSDAWKIALALPGSEERLWFNKPAVFIHDQFLTKVHDKEDGMVLRIGSMEMRDMMLEAEPKLFYITDHYRKFPFALARLSALGKKDAEGDPGGPRGAAGGGDQEKTKEKTSACKKIRKDG